jgi:sugar/nucleoside kinase (ribokinase family)
MRLGILGTLVWDRIHARAGRQEPLEEWGGIGYALGAAAAAAPPAWRLVPVIKVGRDLESEAFRFLHGMARLELETGVRVVDAPNNRVELRYHDSERRCERLTGGVPPWTWPELEPIVAGLDALYLNFISGFELSLETAVRLRQGFAGPIYADLHSLLLGVGPDGTRTPRPLASWHEWLRCFDAVQVNEEELALLAALWGGDPWRFAAEIIGAEPRLLLVTLGARGAAYVAAADLSPDPATWQRPAIVTPGIARPRPARTGKVEAYDGGREGDPTGCGDVWGATFFTRLLAGEELIAAMTAAGRSAAKNVEHLGATGLHHHLSGRLGP